MTTTGQISDTSFIKRVAVTVAIGIAWLLLFWLVDNALALGGEDFYQNYYQLIFAAFILGAFAFGVFGPSRGAATGLAVVVVVMNAIIACADPRDALHGMCVARGGGGDALPIMWVWLLVAPVVLGVLLGVLLGLKWEGRRLTTRWSSNSGSPN